MARPVIERSDAGFTLVELLIAITIEAMIMGALGLAFIGILRSGTTVSESLSRSGDARIAAGYIISDARNSSGPEISLSDTTSCPDASPPVSGAASPIVRFNWSTTSASGLTTSNIVNYVKVGTYVLRRECQGGSLVSDSPVARTVSTVVPVCAPTADCSGSPTSITVTITETADSNGAVYQYSLTGTFRKLIGGGAPSTPSPIFLLGAGDCSSGATGLKIAGGAALRVYGTADINSGDIAGGGGCKAMQIGTNANNYQAGNTQIYTGASGGTCAASGSSTCPAITNYSPALPDPYASLPALAGVPAGACSGTNPTPVGNAYPAGVYPLALNIPATATFSGTYIFCAGISFTNGARVTGSNVLFYFKGGSLSEAGDSQVALSAATSGSYHGLVVWEPVANTTAMTITNGGKFALDGAIYAPGAQVSFAGGSVTTTVTSIVCKTISLSGGASVTLGTPSATPLSFSLPGGLATSWPLGYAYASPALTGVGGDGNYSWSAINLPTNLNIDANTGAITGSPTVVGAKSVTITLSDALGDDVATQTFTLTIDSVPTLASTNPASRGQGATNQNITLTGTKFINGAVASFSGTGITVNSTTFNSATSLTANVTIASNATLGARNVTVTNPDTGTVTTNGIFTVNAGPTVTTTSPNTKGRGLTSQSITVNGSGFVSGAGLAASFGSGITVNSTTFVSANQVTANIDIAAAATLGSRDVTVTNPDGGSATSTNAFTVVAPTITNVQLLNKAGGTAGKVEAGDQIVVTFSSLMSQSAVCAAWTPDTTNHSVSVTGNLVTVTDGGAGNDSITVFAPAANCASGFNIGTINLVSTAYVTGGNVTFGTAATKSTYAWTAATNTLTITFGTQAGAGTPGTVGSSTPIYTASGSNTDSGGAGLTNSPFTLPAGQKF